MGLLSRIFGERPGEDRSAEVPGASGRRDSIAASNQGLDVDDHIRNGLEHHQAGDLQLAERAYRTVLDAVPDHALAHYLLGSLLGASGRLDEALEHLQTAVRLDPSAVAPRSDLGNVFRAQGRTQDAEAAYRDAIEIDPEFPGAHRNLGDLLRHQGRLDDAIESLARTASLVPDDADAHFMLADVLSSRGRYEEACRSYRLGLSIAPQVAAAHNNLGASLRHLSRTQEALECFEAALRVDPDNADAHINLADMMESVGSVDKAIEHYRAAVSHQAHGVDCRRNLGRLLLVEGRSEEALQCYREVLTYEPESARSHFELGNALTACDRNDEAMERFAQAVRLDPRNTSAHVNLGYALNSSKRFEEAAQQFRQALNIEPDLVEAHNNLGGILQMQGELEPAMRAYERALALAPSELYIHSNYLTCLNYHDEAVPENVFEQHRHWAELVESTAATRRSMGVAQRDPERRLRIGYVSADFRYHSVAFFIAPIIERHDREKFQITCYAQVAKPDANTERIKGLSDRWRDIASMSDAEVAALIRHDGIDILVDLSGHTVGNRLPVFARRPAPVQVTYLGYPNTTGLDAMDYRLTDAMADPPGCTEALNSEQLVRFDDGFLCYQPLDSCPDIRKGGGSDDCKNIVFGSFNELLKVTPPTVAAWCEVLERVPDSQLIIKGTTLEDEGTSQLVLDRFARHGVDTGRIRLIGRTRTLEEHLEIYNGIDVALDTFPYNGTTTTCEALWMGVPVVSQCGRVHASRVGSSLLSQVGLDDLVAENAQDYVDKTVNLAGDFERRRQLRNELRDRMRNSSLMDTEGFTRKVESAYRDMWRRACGAEESRAAAGSDETDSLSIRIKGGIRVRVPSGLGELTPYVLLEQEDWFEDEIHFVRHFVKPGMRCLDIGANYGVFSLTLAKQVGPDGRVWSFEPTPRTAEFLSDSLTENEFHNVTLLRVALSRESGMQKLVVHADSEHNYLSDNVTNDDEFEIVDVKCLDELTSGERVEHIDFVKMDAEGAEIAILEGGREFFQRESPVLMFELKDLKGLNWNLVDALEARGFEIYRLVPGLQILIPFDRDHVDPYLLNLFACKPDRARSLEADGLAISRMPTEDVSAGDGTSTVQDILGTRPYTKTLWPRWRETLSALGEEPSGKRVNDLSLYCRAWDTSLPMADRFQALCAAHAAMSEPRAGSAEAARLFSLARVSWELGYRQQAFDVLNAICETADSGIRTPGTDPFLAVSDRFDEIDPSDEFEQWCLASAIDQRERLSAYSSYFRGQQALEALETLRQTPFQCAEMERRRQLVRLRLGIQDSPTFNPLLSNESDDNLNAEFWSRGNGEMKSA